MQEIQIEQGEARRVVWPHERTRPRLFQRMLSEAISFVGWAIRTTVWKPRGRYDIVVIDYDSKRLIGGRRANCITLPTIECLVDRYHIAVIDSARYADRADDAYECDVVNVRLDHLLARLAASRCLLTRSEKRDFAEIEQAISDEFGVSISIAGLVRKVFLPQYFLRVRFERKLREWTPKLVLFQNDGTRYVQEAARNLGVPFVELQHGATFHGDPFTSYGADTKIATMPDSILTFGEYWNSKFATHAPRRAVGFPYMEERLEGIKRRAIVRSPKLVVGVSVISYELADILLALAKARPDLHIVYKLRHEEYATWRRLYPPELVRQPNIQVLDDERIPLFELLAKATYVISTACTTAIVEGLCLGATPIIIASDCEDMVRDLIDKRNIAYVEDSSQLIAAIAQGTTLVPVRNNAFYRTNARRHLSNAIDDIVSTRCQRFNPPTHEASKRA